MHEGAPLTPRPWRRQLQEERKVRQQKEQYAALARQINQYPPREETQAEIHALSTELVPPACPLKSAPIPTPPHPPPRLAPPPPARLRGLNRPDLFMHLWQRPGAQRGRSASVRPRVGDWPIAPPRLCFGPEFRPERLCTDAPPKCGG